MKFVLLFVFLVSGAGCISHKVLLTRTADEISIRVDSLIRYSGALVDSGTAVMWVNSVHYDLSILNDSLLSQRPGWFMHKSKWKAYCNDYYFLVLLHLNVNLNAPAFAAVLNNYAKDAISIQRITARWRRHIAHP